MARNFKGPILFLEPEVEIKKRLDWRLGLDYFESRLNDMYTFRWCTRLNSALPHPPNSCSSRTSECNLIWKQVFADVSRMESNSND